MRIPSSKRGATFFCPCPVLLEKDAGHYRMFLHVSSRFCREREFVHVSVLRDNAKEKYGSQDSHRRGEEGTRGGQMFSQRSNEKWSSPLSRAIDADKNSFLYNLIILIGQKWEARYFPPQGFRGTTLETLTTFETFWKKNSQNDVRLRCPATGYEDFHVTSRKIFYLGNQILVKYRIRLITVTVW